MLLQWGSQANDSQKKQNKTKITLSVGTACHQVGLQWLVPAQLFNSSLPCRAVLPPPFLCFQYFSPSLPHPPSRILQFFRIQLKPSPYPWGIVWHIPLPSCRIDPSQPCVLTYRLLPWPLLYPYLHMAASSSCLERGGGQDPFLFVSGPSVRKTDRHWNVCLKINE